MLVITGLMFLLTIYVDGYTLYRLIYSLPGFSSLRAISRVILVIMFPLSALFGMLIDDLTAPSRYRPRRLAIAAILSALMIVECALVRLRHSSPALWRGRLEALEAQLPKEIPPGAVLAVKTPPIGPSPDWYLGQLDAQLIAVAHGIATMNGYSGNFPPGWRPMSTCSDVEYNLRAGRRFLVEHGLPIPDLKPSQLILVGFEDCDSTELASVPRIRLGDTHSFATGGDGEELADNGLSPSKSWEGR